MKRALDIFFSWLGLTLAWPLLALAGIMAVIVNSGLPVMFNQSRIVLNGRPFSLKKFRTMRVLRGAEAGLFKPGDQSRVTAVGRYLRKMSLDELPQLVNILRGEMSFVGPRPPIPAEVEKYEPWQRRRLSMKPGLTCIWQVYGRNGVAFDEWMRMDLAYIDNWSIILDAKLILMTGNAVLRATGT